MRGAKARGVACGDSKKEAKREAAERCCLDLSARILTGTKGKLSDLILQVTVLTASVPLLTTTYKHISQPKLLKTPKNSKEVARHYKLASCLWEDMVMGV